MERQIDRFDAKTDDGRVFSVVVYQEFIDATSIGDKARKWIPGMKRITLSDGSPVNYIDANTFKVFGTDEIIRKVGV